MTDNENRQRKPEEGDNAARRDGDRYSKEGYNANPWRKPTDRSSNAFDRPRRSYGEGGFDRPRRSYDNDGNRFDAFGEPSRFDRPRRSYEESGNRFASGSSRYGNTQEGGFSRPRRPVGEGGFDRPRRPYGENKPDRPYRPQGEGGFGRPRRAFDGEGNRFGHDGNRFGGENNRYGGDGNRFSGSREGGFDRPRRSFGETSRTSFGGPTLPRPERADGRPRRPRIKKSSTFDHGTPYGHPTSFQPDLDPNTPIRLNKFLANAGICSRREADEFIQAGVVKLNGEVVSELGVKVKPTDTILFHDQPVSIERKVYILLNKPKDCVTTSDDPEERLTVMDLVKGACYERIYPVGRLDRNTTGVLLLTNDGDLASKLTHPKYEKRKIYQVTLDRNLAEADFKTILAGVTLDDEPITVDNLSYVDPNKANVIGIEIHSGQNRVVRRIFESLNYKVFKLDRVYFAGLTKKNLPRGKWRHLTEKEVSLLKMGAFV